jgi:hypothetical protein
MPLALRSRFVVGVYDPNFYDSWPYFFSHEGIFLSKNKRLCSWKSAIEFDQPQQARDFYSSWKHASSYRLKVVEFKTRIHVPDFVFADDHPRSILNRIRDSESSYVHSTALVWFLGKTDFYWSKSTLSRHRKILLNYGIDINLKPHQLLEPLPNLDDDTWYLPMPSLTIV